MVDVPREKAGFFDQMRRAVQRTQEGLAGRVGLARTVDGQALEELEALLSTADMGRETVRGLLDALGERARQQAIKDGAGLRAALREQLLTILSTACESHARPQPGLGEPYVTFLVGANGTGKTTTGGKLAMWNRGRKRSVMLCAADTFRAAAIEQLQDWATRSGAEIFKSRKGSDPAVLVSDAVAHARARRIDELIVDTAGRLHTKTGLMDELDHMIRAAASAIPNAPHEVLLVMDATTGQNGLHQARLFAKSAGITGIVLTKLDGTARGGVAVAIAKELNLPVRFMGVGEQMDDFMEFFPEAFVDSLLEDEPAAN